MSNNRTFTVPDFGPNDLLTSDKIGDRAVKVSLENLSDIERILIEVISRMNDQLENISIELKLLNARYEEACETGINEGDIDGNS